MWTRRKCGRSANDGCRRGFAARLIRIARFYILGGHSPSAICDSSSFVRGWTIRRSAVMGSRKNLRPFHVRPSMSALSAPWVSLCCFWGTTRGELRRCAAAGRGSRESAGGDLPYSYAVRASAERSGITLRRPNSYHANIFARRDPNDLFVPVRVGDF